jgi:hypothetical protein
MPRIGYLASSSLAITGRMVAALRQGLSDLGYIDGKRSQWNGRTLDRDAEEGAMNRWT